VGIHWKTFNRLKNKYERLDDEWHSSMAKFLNYWQSVNEII
jgi:hypothetical protein